MNDYKRVLLVVLGAILLLPVGFGIRDAINDKGEKNARMFNTAIQATEPDRFNYAVDSHQGKVLTYGHFKPTKLVKFPEMSAEFAYVEKIKEEYTRHERTVCETKYRSETRTRSVTNSDGSTSTETYTEQVPYEECHQEVYYTWDHAGSDEKSTPAWRLHAREYAKDVFSTGQFEKRPDACKFLPAGKNFGWLDPGEKSGCDDGYLYIDDDTRYDYRVIAADGFSAGFIADASNGKLEPLSGSKISLQQKSVEQMVAEANDYKTPGNVFIVFWWILVLGCMGAAAYAWAMNDGVWSDKA